MEQIINTYCVNAITVNVYLMRVGLEVKGNSLS